MLIPPEKLQEILERTDIVALVSRFVELKRSGRAFKGLCPFHGERTPSFSVSPERRRFKCFGCGEGGDAIRFLMLREGLGFVEAARRLAGEAGIPIETGEGDRLLREKLDVKKAHEIAARFYQQILWDERAGKPGRDHLARRGLSEAAARAFGLGYAPASWDALAREAERQGASELLLQAGLLARKEGGDGHRWDFFRGRLMIPIRGLDGAPVAFGGRTVEGDDSRKFVNSRESAAFRKGETLFALPDARDAIRRSGQALLVEGYFDAIALHQAGLCNAVAVCGTALGPAQIQLLRRLDAREVVLVLDGDEAGRRGVAHAAPPLFSSGMPARVAVLPAGVDPDEHVRAVGAAGFSALVAGAAGLTEHLIQDALPARSAATVEAKQAALEALRPLLAQIPEGLERSFFLTALAKALAVAEIDLRARLGEGPARARPKAAPPPAPAPARAREPAGEPLRPADVLEESFLAACLLVDPSLAREAEAATLEDLSHPVLRAFAGELIQSALDGRPIATDEILDDLPEGLGAQLRAVARQAAALPADARRRVFAEKCGLRRARLAQREERQMQREIRALKARIDEARREGAAGAALSTLLAEHLELTREMQAHAAARRAPALGSHRRMETASGRLQPPRSAR